jgi:hypothetical protein
VVHGTSCSTKVSVFSRLLPFRPDLSRVSLLGRRWGALSIAVSYCIRYDSGDNEIFHGVPVSGGKRRGRVW